MMWLRSSRILFSVREAAKGFVTLLCSKIPTLDLKTGGPPSPSVSPTTVNSYFFKIKAVVDLQCVDACKVISNTYIYIHYGLSQDISTFHREYSSQCYVPILYVTFASADPNLRILCALTPSHLGNHKPILCVCCELTHF